MQDHAEESMWDTCQVLEYNGMVTDDYGQPSPDYFLRWPVIVCGYDGSAHVEVMQETQVVLTDAVVRLPIDTVLDNRDRITITKRHGVALAAMPTYEIIGEPARGPSALVLGLRLVTDGSDET
jgi:hypothetical protein